MSVYASALPLAWTLFSSGVVCFIQSFELGDDLKLLLRNRYVEEELIIGAVSALPSLIVLLWYVVAVSRGTTAARWANR